MPNARRRRVPMLARPDPPPGKAYPPCVSAAIRNFWRQPIAGTLHRILSKFRCESCLVGAPVSHDAFVAAEPISAVLVTVRPTRCNGQPMTYPSSRPCHAWFPCRATPATPTTVVEGMTREHSL